MWQPSFTRALAGGILIGTSASLLLATVGRVAGWSGIIGGLVTPEAGHIRWRFMMLGGLLVGGLVASLFLPGAIAVYAMSPSSYALLAVAGVLVGAGTRIGGGCTSGHGVCGISRGSTRSIVGTIVFIIFGMAAVFAMRLAGIIS